MLCGVKRALPSQTGKWHNMVQSIKLVNDGLPNTPACLAPDPSGTQTSLEKGNQPIFPDPQFSPSNPVPTSQEQRAQVEGVSPVPFISSKANW